MLEVTWLIQWLVVSCDPVRKVNNKRNSLAISAYRKRKGGVIYALELSNLFETSDSIPACPTILPAVSAANAAGFDGSKLGRAGAGECATAAIANPVHSIHSQKYAGNETPPNGQE
jgi:hypothetical protein